MYDSTVIATKNLNLWYNEKHALQNITMEIEKKKTTALIGPSGCGKSTLLRCFNRMNDLIGQVKITGQLLLDNEDMLCNGMDVVALRKRVGMVFQRPNPFPKSVYENVADGPRVHGINDRKELDAIVEKSLATRHSGRRSGTGSTIPLSGSRAASSSGSVSREPLRSGPR